MTELAAVPPVEVQPSIWSNRKFLAVWIGHFISVIGDGFHSVALALWVLQTTGSATAMGTIMAVRVVTGILLGTVAGAVADRADRRMLMVVTDFLRFVLVGGIAVLLASPGASFSALLMMAVMTGIASQFFGPAFQASLRDIVGKENVPRAASAMQISNVLGQVVGPFLGGSVVMLIGGWAAMTVDALTFLISGAFILLAGPLTSTVQDQEPRPRGSFWSEIGEGLTYIRRQPLVASVVVIAPMINFFGNALGVILPVIALRVWLVNSFQFGVIEALFPLGFAIGAAVIMAMSGKLRRRGWWMMGSAAASGLLVAMVGISGSFQAAIPFLLLTGISLAIINVLFQITLQSEVPPEVQGRVFGTLGSLVNVASPASMLLAGVTGDVFSPVIITVVCGLAIALVSLVSLAASPSLRGYN